MPDPATPPGPTSYPGDVRAPFHGLVTLVIDVGDAVQAGEVVAVLEAMKMEAPITAPHAGTVTEVTVEVTAEGTATVTGGQLLLRIT